MPRPYRADQRQAAAEQTRIRMLDAARELLMSEIGASRFTVDAVARTAGVARMTVYYQFGSKVGLLEALCDHIGARGGMRRLGEVFKEEDPLRSLDLYIETFMRFWESDRVVTRRLRALAALDEDFGSVIRTRDEWRRGAAQNLANRLSDAYGIPARDNVAESIEVLLAITGFATYDTLASSHLGIEAITRIVQSLARSGLGLTASESDSSSTQPSSGLVSAGLLAESCDQPRPRKEQPGCSRSVVPSEPRTNQL